ncbi:MAG TPA: class I SAM-dependent methyltransferase, partial [Rhabdochlamydiaceae bacterium]|nr:class I SAM-dependent methyltransferase [Rhabdochlamydiaceae bacterium]
GGQCKILSDLFVFSNYTLIDTPESLALAERYLSQLNVPHVHFAKADEVENQSCDLVISHYGFTQTDAQQQKDYLRKILSKADRGYLICNFFPKTFGISALSKENLLKQLSKAGISYEILPEEPLTGQNHFIIMWSK